MRNKRTHLSYVLGSTSNAIVGSPEHKVNECKLYHVKMYLIVFAEYIKPFSLIQYGKIAKLFQRKIVNIFLLIFLMHVLDAQKNRLIETVLLSTTSYVLFEK